MKIIKAKKSSLKKKGESEIVKEAEDKFSDDEKLYDTGTLD